MVEEYYDQPIDLLKQKYIKTCFIPKIEICIVFDRFLLLFNLLSDCFMGKDNIMPGIVQPRLGTDWDGDQFWLFKDQCGPYFLFLISIIVK